MANSFPPSGPHQPIRVTRPPIRVDRNAPTVSRVIRLKIEKIVPPPPPAPVIESQVLERDGFDLQNIHQQHMSDRFNHMKPRIQDYFDRLWSALEAEGLTEVPEGEKRYQAFLIDSSGSMGHPAGNGMTRTNVMEFVSIFLALLSEKLKEPISIFSYSNDPTCLTPWPDVAGKVFSNSGMPAAIMLGIRPGGAEDPPLAFERAHQSLSEFEGENAAFGGKGRVVCFTDGDLPRLDTSMLRPETDYATYSLDGHSSTATSIFGAENVTILDLSDEEKMLLEVLRLYLPKSFVDKLDLTKIFAKNPPPQPTPQNQTNPSSTIHSPLTGWRAIAYNYPVLRKLFGLQQNPPIPVAPVVPTVPPQTPANRISRPVVPPSSLGTTHTPSSLPVPGESAIRIVRDVVEGDEIEKRGIPLLPFLDESKGIYIGSDGRKYRLCAPPGVAIDLYNLPLVDAAIKKHGVHGIRYLDSTPRKLIAGFKEAHEVPRDSIPFWDTFDLKSWEKRGKIEFPSFVAGQMHVDEDPDMIYFSDGINVKSVGGNSENFPIESIIRVREKDADGNEVFRVYRQPEAMSTLGDAKLFENITNTGEYARVVASDYLGGQHDFSLVTADIIGKAQEIREQFPGDIDDPVVQENRVRAAYDFVKSFIYTPAVGNYFRDLDNYYKTLSRRGMIQKLISKAPKKPLPVDPMKKGQSGYMTFREKEGVCAGYAKSLVMLLSFLQIPDVTYVSGVAPPSYIQKPSSGWTDVQKKEYAHAWIKIGDKHYDPTFDNQHSNSINFFGISDTVMQQTHNREWK